MIPDTERAAPDEPQHELATVPTGWIYTHNRLCPCGEIVTERGWLRHQAQHTANGKATTEEPCQ